uniref:Xin actin-binding repeat-containing protein 2 n=1 Tax=Cyclopterus lumpus TaxID=8103 RepID=A0A8C3B0F9_CYCLU
MDYEDFPPPPDEDSDYLPPPPPDLLEMPSEGENIPACYYSPEPPEPANPSKYPLNKEAYCKQRSMYELKRLYKHIHPEVRKNIEKECYNDYTETENNHLENQEYMYEDDGGSPNDINDEEFMEWEEILPGEVQAMRWMFENKPLDSIKDETPDEEDDYNKITEQEMILGKDVRRTAWMFETKPMDELNVRAAAWLFETQTMDTLNKMHKEEDLTKEIVFTEEDGNATIYMIDNKYMESLGNTETIDESHLLRLRSVLEEIHGEVKTVTSTFDTQFKCIIMGQSSQMLEIKSVRKIESELENSIASRWLFDTQPLDMTNTESTSLKLVCSLSMEDSNKGDWGRWLFEIKTLDSLNEWESSNMEKKEVTGADVRKHCLVFETQPMDSMKDDSNARPQSIEEIIGGNVRSARHFFESSPRAERKTDPEVGKLQKATINDEIKGDVRHQKWRFESQPLEHIREEKKEVTRTVNVEDDLTQEDGTSCRADVRKNCWVFETKPMDSLKDDSNTQLLTKEDIIAGNVRSARQYFETVPGEELKELAEMGKLKRTVTLNEEKGDVRHQKWRFESLNWRDESQKILIEGVTSGSVKANTNLFESTSLYAMQDSSGHFHEVKTVRREEVVKGDVTTCKWMFETRPIDQFDECIDKYQIIKGISKEEIESGDVKTAKWLFETQPLDAIKYFSNIEDEEVMGPKTNLEHMKGDVKTCKWLFETKPMDLLYERAELKGENESEETQKGDVKTSTWLFETQALDSIHDVTETILKTCTVNQEDIRGKDVRTACFLFETEKLENLSGEETGSFKREVMQKLKTTYSLDEIQETDKELMKMRKIVRDEDERGNVRNYTMMFENQPLYAIQDKEGLFHEVTTVTSEEVTRGDVVGTRWKFETKPLDAIKDTDEIYIIKSVTQQDVQKEMSPLPSGNLRHNHSTESVRTVNVSEIQKGDVRSAKWRFETQSIDKIRSMSSENLIETVKKEDVEKGDVKHSVWWLFETTPFDDFNETKMEKTDEIGDVRMAKYQLMNKQAPEIQREDDVIPGDVQNTVKVFMSEPTLSLERLQTEEIVKGNLNATLNLLSESANQTIVVEKEEVVKGNIPKTLLCLEKAQKQYKEVEKPDIIRGNIKGALKSLEKSSTSRVEVVVEDLVSGDVRATLKSL